MLTVGELDSALPLADFVVLATPLTPETRNLLDRRRIGLMKSGAGFFNIGRARSVDHDALVEALGSGARFPVPSSMSTTRSRYQLPHRCGRPRT